MRLGEATGNPNSSGRAPRAPYWIISFSKGCRDWGLMPGKWKWMPGFVYASYWRKPILSAYDHTSHYWRELERHFY